MRPFQVLLVVLLTAISLELGLIAIKLPTPAAHAAPIQAPGTALEDPHDVLKRQLGEVQRQIADVQRELAGDRQRLVAVEQQITRMSQSIDKVAQNVQSVTQNEEKVLSRVSDSSRRELVTCFMTAWTFIKIVPGVGTTGPAGYCTAKGWLRPSGPSLAMDFDTPFGP